MDPPTYPFEETSFMNGPLLILIYVSQKILGTLLISTYSKLGTIHKGRLLKGVGRWVHQKEIY